VLNAARLVFWTDTDPATRELQVGVAVSLFHRYLKTAEALHLPIDGQPDRVCAAVCDVMHQHGERAKTAQLGTALSSPDPMPSLYTLMGDYDRHRPDRFKGRLEQLQASGVFGKRHWSIAANDFVMIIA
jgi:hypothetical protein